MSSKTAADMMTREVTTITADQSIGVMLEIIATKHYSGLPVVDADGPIGLVSQNDVLRALVAESGSTAAIHTFLDRPVQSVMTAGVISCASDTSAADVGRGMDAEGIHRLVVLDGQGQIAGLISATDLARTLS